MSDSDRQTQMLYGFNYMQSMRMLFTQGLYYDVELIIRDKRYKTHKSILHAASPLFRTKLDQNIRELVMDCEGIRDESITKVFVFLYKGTVELRVEQIANVVKLAEMWQMDELKKYCYSYLETLCRENRQVSQKNKKIDYYLLNNFPKLTKHERFLKLSADNLKRLLSSDDLHVSSEEQVFEGLFQWIKHDWTNRKNDLYSLMKCIRFPLCSVSFLLDKVSSLCCETVEECHLLLDALKWHQMPQKRSTIPLMNSNSRIENKHVLVFGGFNFPQKTFLDHILNRSPIATLYAYNPTTNSWTHFYSKEINNMHFSTVIFKNNLFMFGGWECADHNNVYLIDLSTYKLNRLVPMVLPRSQSTAAVVNNKIFVMGGNDSKNVFNSVEQYDFVENIWRFVGNMIIKRYNHASVVYKDDIYVFGGENFKDYLNSVEVYCTKKNQWKLLTPMKRKRSSFAAVVVGDYIYCIGGRNTCVLESVERYDPGSDTWTELSSFPVGVCAHCAICYSSKIICFGGVESKSVLEYDTTDDQWRVIGEMPKARCDLSAFLVDRIIS